MQRVTDERIAELLCAVDDGTLLVTALGDAEPEQFGGTWLLYQTPDGNTDEFYLSENRIRAIASWLRLRDILADLKEVRAALRAVEWAKPLVTSIHNAGSYCPFCSASKQHGHTQHCRIGKALAATEETDAI